VLIVDWFWDSFYLNICAYSSFATLLGCCDIEKEIHSAFCIYINKQGAAIVELAAFLSVFIGQLLSF